MTQMSHPSYDLLAATSWFCHMPSLTEQKNRTGWVQSSQFYIIILHIKIKRENYVKLYIIINR